MRRGRSADDERGRVDRQVVSVRSDDQEGMRPDHDLMSEVAQTPVPCDAERFGVIGRA